MAELGRLHLLAITDEDAFDLSDLITHAVGAALQPYRDTATSGQNDPAP